MFRLAPQPPPSRSPNCPELLRKVPRHLTFTRSHTFHPLVDRNRYVPLPRKSSAFQRGAFSEASARCLTSGNSLTTSTRCGFAFTHRTIFETPPALPLFSSTSTGVTVLRHLRHSNASIPQPRPDTKVESSRLCTTATFATREPDVARDFGHIYFKQRSHFFTMSLCQNRLQEERYVVQLPRSYDQCLIDLAVL